MCAGKSCSSCKKSSCSSGPIVLNPITVSDESAGKYSIETRNQKSVSGGLIEKIYTGTVGTGASAAAPVYASLVQAVSDIIRVIALQTYTNPATAIDPVVDLATIEALQAYFTVGQTPALTTGQQAYVDHVVSNVYSVFTAIAGHISETSEPDPNDVCSTGTAKLYQAEISTCLFCMKFIIA